MRVITKVYLWFLILMSIVFALPYVISPSMLTNPLGYGNLAPSALTDLRAMFGGFQLAMAAFIGWCLKVDKVRVALMYAFLGALAFVICRGYGLLVDHSAVPVLVETITFEATLTIVALLLYRIVPAPALEAAPSNNSSSGGAKIFLVVMGVVNIAFGALSAVDPVLVVSPMGFGHLAPTAMTDMRASYGGFQLGFGLFALWCLKADEIFAGVLCILITVALVAICRVVGLAVDGMVTTSLISALIFELGVTIVALVFAFKVKPEAKSVM